MSIRSLRLVFSFLILATFPASYSVRAADQPILQLDVGGHMAVIKDVAFTRDGKFVVSVGNDKQIRIWDWRAKKTIRTMRGQIGPGSEGKIYGADLSPDGRYLAVGGWMKIPGQSGHHIRVYNFESGEIEFVLKGHTNVVHVVRYSNDGRYLVSGSSDNNAIIWDMHSRKMLNRLKGHTNDIYAVDFLPDGRRVVTGADDRTMRLWDVRSGQLIKEMRGHKKEVFAVAVSPNGIFIASGSDDKTVRLWDGNTGEFIRQLGQHKTQIGSMSFSPDGRYLLATCGGGGCSSNPDIVYEVATGRRIVNYRGHDNVVLATDIMKDPDTGRYLVVSGGGNKRQIHVWDLLTGKLQAELLGVGASVWAANFTDEGNRIGWSTRFSRSGPLGRGKPDLHLRLPQADRALGVPLPVKDGALFKQAIDTIGSYSIKRRRGGPYGGYAILDIKKDGQVVASVTRDSTTGYDHRSYTFLPDGRTIISGGSNGELAAFDLKGKMIGEFIGHDGDVWAVSSSPDGRLLISSGGDQTVRIWNTRTYELLVTLFRGRNREWVMWTPQGYYAASANGDQMIGWQINQGATKEARYVTGAQLKDHFYRPDLVERAILLGSSRAAVQELGKTDFSLNDLSRRSPPEFAILNPVSGADSPTSPVSIEVEIAANKDPVKGFSISVNGRQVTGRALRGLERVNPGKHTRSLQVPISQGENRIKITAFNAVGETVREVLVRYNKQGELDKRGTLYLVSIGVDRYPNLPGQDLSFAGVDAKAFHKTMLEQAGPLHANVKQLLFHNGAVNEPNANNIRDAFDLFAEAGPEDTVILFLAGHGINEGSDYLFLPTDAKRRGKRFRSSTVIKWRDLHGALQDARGRRIMMVDTCHSGSAFNRRLVKDASDANIVVFSATDSETLAQERPELGHGVFTHALLQGLSGKADLLKDGEINLLELGTFVSAEVKRLTNKAQAPTFHLAGTSDFVFAGLR